MEHRVLIVQFLIVTCAAGLFGAACMAGLMKLLSRKGLVNTDMIVAVGSIFTKSLDSAGLVGGLLHAISGVIFAMVYALVMSLFGVHGLLTTIAVSGGMGAVHGFIMCFIMVASVAEHHPIPQFREAGMGVAVAHLLGHVMYGLGVGLILGWAALPL